MSYSIEDSPLHGLPSKKKLCDLLFVHPNRLRALMSDSEYRREWWTKSGRLIEEPLDSLKAVQGRIKELVSRIQHPAWLYSGVRGKSYIDNAEQHAGQQCLCSIDIDSFFQSTRKEYVFRFFRYLLCQPEDVAWAVSDLATYKNHLPTGGSPSSQALAFWAYRPMFELMHEKVQELGGVLTLYVDDIAISTDDRLTDDAFSSLEGVMSGFELRINESKTERRGREQWKVVTGAAISPTGSLDVPNRLRKKIYDHITLLKEGSLDESGVLRLLGLLTSARQIDHSFHDSLYRYVRYLARSLR